MHPLGPFDITLIAKDGKEFKAHRQVLSEASPFFKNLLESDMKENKEGVVRLETLTELLMEEILGFIYTGDVQILGEENASELIEAGDYLFLPNLKTVAGRFIERSMTTLNCISTYNFAETYQCDELAARARTFIQSNFATVAKSEEFLNLTSQEVEEWISSDEIVINAEEDVFNIIREWIAKEPEKRSGKFEELFRHVRLVFASRDFLLKELATNALMQQNQSCMDRVTQAMDCIDRATGCDPPWPNSQSPRKNFGSNVLVAYGKWSVACYLPEENEWYKLPEKGIREECDIVPYDGKLHAITRRLHKAEHYDPFCNKWILKWSNGSDFLETNKRAEDGQCILAANGQIYAVVVAFNIQDCKYRYELVKYDTTSHSWQLLPSSYLDERCDVCTVACNRHIYVMGGYERLKNHLNGTGQVRNGAARFDTASNTWEEIATIQEARGSAFGATANGKVYIAGGIGAGHSVLKSCEVYNETTNEWQFIARLTVPRYCGSMMCVEDTLYVLGGCIKPFSYALDALEGGRHTTNYLAMDVECYDCGKDKWYKKTTLPRLASSEKFLPGGYKGCSARFFKGFLSVKSAKRGPVHECAIT